MQQGCTQTLFTKQAAATTTYNTAAATTSGVVDKQTGSFARSTAFVKSNTSAVWEQNSAIVLSMEQVLHIQVHYHT